MFKDVPEEFAHRILDSGKALRIVLKVKQRRNIGDDTGDVGSFTNMIDGNETAGFLVFHLLRSVVDPKVFEESHPSCIASMAL